MKFQQSWLIKFVLIAVSCFLLARTLSAQFIENFNDTDLPMDSSGNNGWSYFSGDGSATMRFQPGNGYASVLVDATSDRQNIWWALIKRRVSASLDMDLLTGSNYELQIEARIRVSHAPKRVNLHLNTQRTTDFHSHLMEYDIPDTLNWHTISMTTHNFKASPGDSIYGQMALMDWGREKYRVDVDYFKVQIVNVDTVSPEKGNPLPYRPPVPSPDKFKYHLSVAQDAMLDENFPDENYNQWHVQNEAGKIYLLTVGGSQLIILRWDLGAFSGRRAAGSGVLELTTWSVQRLTRERKDFGMIRVHEILNGYPDWVQENVTYSNFCRGEPLSKLINMQMIIDVDATDGQGQGNLITISNPVLQRMLDGKTTGLAILPLGPVNASFLAMENQAINPGSILHFNLDSAED